MKLIIIFDNFGPYHLARLNAARHYGQKLGTEVMGLEIVKISSDYDWITSNDRIRTTIFTLFSNNDGISRRPSAHTKFIGVWQALSKLEADALAIPGYQGVVSLAAFLWAKTKKKPLIMMSESTLDDKTRSPFLEWCKRQIVRRYDGALVGGQRQLEYAAFLGIPRQRVFLGYDVVDNAYFTREAETVCQREQYYRQVLNLPNPFFLTVSRFIPKKNLSRLIQAYADYRHLVQGQAWDLVICGSGPLEAELKRQSHGLSGVHFPGFVQIDKLPIYYGLASTFILPSSHFEQWGLVVNEAMASGLPVLVSQICGCAADLVQQGVNGFTFDPHDIENLSRLMMKMSQEGVDLQGMGEASRRIIARLTPDTFAENLIKALKSAGS